MKTLYIADEV